MRASDFESTVEQRFQIGPHSFRFEPPDILFMHFSGPVEAEQFHEFYATTMELKSQGQIYIVRDTRSGGSLDSKARSAVIKTVDPQRVAAIISYGSSFHLRVIVTMLTKAMRTFKPSAPRAVFVDSEDEARAWIATHRNTAKSS
jgi:hypothetical protein